MFTFCVPIWQQELQYWTSSSTLILRFASSEEGDCLGLSSRIRRIGRRLGQRGFAAVQDRRRGMSLVKILLLVVCTWNSILINTICFTAARRAHFGGEQHPDCNVGCTSFNIVVCVVCILCVVLIAVWAIVFIRLLRVLSEELGKPSVMFMICVVRRSHDFGWGNKHTSWCCVNAGGLPSVLFAWVCGYRYYA